MNIKSTRERLLASTVIVSALSLVAGAQASAQAVQTAPATSTGAATAPGGGGAADVLPQTGANGEATASSGQSTAVQEVVVTGSRIPQPGLTSVSPLTVVTDQEIKLEGTTNVESLLNNLPQAFAEQTSQVSNGATGIATVNLRNLGSKRTLVLVDGKRLEPGDPTTPVADLNNIPAQLVDRVEVTTGGASAIYGSDAVAGVVNFVMKHDFQGVRFDVQGGFAQTGNSPNSAVDGALNGAILGNVYQAPGSKVDGREMDYTGIFGVNAPDGKGNVTGYLEYRNTQPVTEDQRRYSACGIGTTNSTTGGPYDTHYCQGSSNNPNGRFTNVALPGQPIPAGAVKTSLSLNPNGTATFVPFTNALTFNFAPYNYIQRQDDRYTAGFFGHYAVNAMFDLYSDFMFLDDHTFAVIAPSGLFQGTGSLGSGVNGNSTFAVNCNNPLLSASEATSLCGTAAGTATDVNLRSGFRFATGAPRTDDLRHTDYKLDIGSRGDLGQGWNYDVYYQYGTSLLTEEYMNDVSVSRVQNALLVNPNGTCMSGGACVPLNLFQLGKLSPAQLSYVEAPGFENGQTTEQVASASVTGDLGQYGARSPLATDGVGLALGSEYRRENLVLNRDEEFTSGDLSGQGGAALSNSGTFDVYELFGEIRVPIVQDKPFVKNLSFDGAYRYSDYSTAGITNTYEAQLTYAVNRDISFRGGYNRAVRAPNVNELFFPQSLGLFGGSDPCAGAAPTASLAACIPTFQPKGASLAQATAAATAAYGTITQCPASQCTQLTSGNTNLAPEKTDTITAGVVLTPKESFARGFTMTVDVFDIKVYNVIEAGFGGQTTLNACVATGLPVYCQNIHRDGQGDLFGSQGYVINTEINSGFLHTQGIDLQADYTLRPNDYFSGPNVGKFSLDVVGTYTNRLTTQPATGGPTYECVGRFGSTCGTPTPRWRSKTRLTWSAPVVPVTLSFQWRYIGGTNPDVNSSNLFLNDGLSQDTADHIVAYNYFDLAGTWKVKDGLLFRAGVNNIGDRDPPVVDANNLALAGPPYGNGNTFPGVYDSLGRTFFIGLTADF